MSSKTRKKRDPVRIALIALLLTPFVGCCGITTFSVAREVLIDLAQRTDEIGRELDEVEP